MRCIPLALASLGALLVAAGPALALEGTGLAPKRDRMPPAGWQGRVAIGATTPLLPPESTLASEAAASARVSGVSLVGDYYFGIAPRWDGGAGLRATGGVLWGSRLAWGGLPVHGGMRNGLLVERQWAGSSDPEAATLPYLGVGYSGLLGAGRFGFSADLGLVAQRPGQAVRLGRVIGLSQSLDDAVRELRLAPVLQLGVSYAF